jgi:hypothetical protein
MLVITRGKMLRNRLIILWGHGDVTVAVTDLLLCQKGISMSLR